MNLSKNVAKLDKVIKKPGGRGGGGMFSQRVKKGVQSTCPAVPRKGEKER